MGRPFKQTGLRFVLARTKNVFQMIVLVLFVPQLLSKSRYHEPKWDCVQRLGGGLPRLISGDMPWKGLRSKPKDLARSGQGRTSTGVLQGRKGEAGADWSWKRSQSTVSGCGHSVATNLPFLGRF